MTNKPEKERKLVITGIDDVFERNIIFHERF